MSSFKSLASAPTGGRPGGGKFGGGKGKPYSAMTAQEKDAWRKDKQAHNIAEAKRMSEGGASAARGAKFVDTWTASVDCLVFQVEDNGALTCSYNHGTSEKPDLQREAYNLPGVFVTRVWGLTGAGIDFEDNDAWKHMCNFNLGLPMPAEVLTDDPLMNDKVKKAWAFMAARDARILHECITNERVYPGLRSGPDDSAGVVASVTGASAENIYQARVKAWNKIVNRKTQELHEDPTDSKSPIVGLELNMSSNSFFDRRPGEAGGCADEVLAVAADPTHDRYREAVAIKNADARGQKLTQMRFQTTNGDLIKCKVFEPPVRDMTPVVSSFTVTWYSSGTNRGCSYHPSVVIPIRANDNVRRTMVTIDTSCFSMRNPRTVHEKSVLRFIKSACALDEAGATVMQLVEKFALASGDDEPEMKTEELTAALNAMVKDKVIQRTEDGTLIMSKMDLDIDSLPDAVEDASKTTDIASVVARAAAEAEKRRLIAAEAAKVMIDTAQTGVARTASEADIGNTDGGVQPPDAKRAKN